MGEHLARIIVADQVVYEGNVPAGHVPEVSFEPGAPITANAASGPVPIPGRFAADWTVVRFVPKPTPEPKPAARTRRKAATK